MGAALLAKVRSANARVEDTAEAALRLYEMAARLPNGRYDVTMTATMIATNSARRDDQAPDRTERAGGRR